MNKKRFRQQNQKKETRVYTKVFDDFKTGVEEAKKISKVIDRLISEAGDSYRIQYEDDSEVTENEYILSKAITSYVLDNKLPDVLNKDTRFWSLSISSNRLFLRTGYKITFGWDFKYEMKKDSYNVTDGYKFTISDIGMDDELKALAEENKWDVEIS